MYTDKYKGIYAYKDNKTNEIVYIGKDSHLYKKARHIQHTSQAHKNRQKINGILQLNPGRYEYVEIIRLPYDTSRQELDGFEIRYIKLYKPKFNFTVGGDGGPTNKGRKFTKEHRIKIAKVNTGKKHSKETREKISRNNARHTLGKHLSDETKQKISKSEKGKEVTLETRIKLSKSQSSTGYYRVQKHYDKKFKQGFEWVYKYREDGKQKKISSVNLMKLESKVKSKGLLWLKLSD